MHYRRVRRFTWEEDIIENIKPELTLHVSDYYLMGFLLSTCRITRSSNYIQAKSLPNTQCDREALGGVRTKQNSAWLGLNHN